jgi:transcription-repair coupling factor (superfamily II helicase)
MCEMCFEQRKSFKWKFANKKTSFSRNTFYGDVADGSSYAVVDKLGKGSFAKLKEKVKDKLFAIANDIIKLAAARELVNGIKIDTNKKILEDFQKTAGFEYTKDQKRSIKEIFDDLSSGRVMDRLLSGDVGFGKTI